MHTYNLGFISDKKVYSVVMDTMEVYQSHLSLERPTFATSVFHRHLFQSLGFEDKKRRHYFDIVDKKRKIFADFIRLGYLDEEDKLHAQIKMQAELLDDKDAMCYFVNPYSLVSEIKAWEFDVFGERQTNPRIQLITVDRLYELLLNDKHAFTNLANVLPSIIGDVLADHPELSLATTYFSPLTHLSPDISTAFYLFSFAHNDGLNRAFTTCEVPMCPTS